VTKVVDLRAELGPPRRQGVRNTCLAFAVSAAHEHGRSRQDPLSVEVLYWGAKQLDGQPGPGTTFEGAAGALGHWGQPDDTLWPYDRLRKDSLPSYEPPAGALDAAVCFNAGMRSVDVTSDAVRSELDAGVVVAIGIPTWSGLRHPVMGRLTNPHLSELDGFFHALVVVGYRLDTNEILLRNSWGTSWGDGGHAWMPTSFVEDHVLEAWAVEPT
jgi:hypothetical protein